MSKTAFVFPGQGAQAVGMGRDAYEGSPAGRRCFEEADQTLGYPLSKLILEGPEEELRQTYHTQPALLTVSMAYYEAFRSSGIRPDYVAGHSLGEYAALTVAGALSYTDALKTVRQRGLFMEEAVPSGLGAMAAVLGADRSALDELCRQLSREAGVAELANINCPGQIVVSGSREGVEALSARAKEAGAKRVVPLEVSGPFHSSLMRPAAEKLRAVLAETAIRDAGLPVVANVTAEGVRKAEEIRELLERQVYSSVLWEDSVQWMIAQGVDTFFEIGSGSVLSGLIKKIDRSVKIYTLNSLEAIGAAADEYLAGTQS